MPDFEEPNPSGSGAAGVATPSERKDSAGQDTEAEPVDPKTAGVRTQTDQPLPDPFFWPENGHAAGEGISARPMSPTQRDEIDEVMARAMRLRTVKANQIITKPADIQRYVDTCRSEELPAAQAAHGALDAAGYTIVRDHG